LVEGGGGEDGAGKRHRARLPYGIQRWTGFGPVCLSSAPAPAGRAQAFLAAGITDPTLAAPRPSQVAARHWRFWTACCVPSSRPRYNQTICNLLVEAFAMAP